MSSFSGNIKGLALHANITGSLNTILSILKNNCRSWVFHIGECIKSFGVCTCVWGCVFTVASWGVGLPYVLSELKGPAVILPERNME